MTNIKYVCRECQSDQVVFDATAEWDQDSQKMVLNDHSEKDAICSECNAPTRCDEIEIPGSSASKDNYSYLEMEAALCVWEHILEKITDSHKGWDQARQDHGAFGLRQYAIDLGVFALKIYDKVKHKYGAQTFDGWAYDWEIIPQILSTLEQPDGEIELDKLPEIDTAADTIFAHYDYQNYLIDCHSAANHLWGFGDMTKEYPEACRAAYDQQQMPLEFVEEFGKKFDFDSPYYGYKGKPQRSPALSWKPYKENEAA